MWNTRVSSNKHKNILLKSDNAVRSQREVGGNNSLALFARLARARCNYATDRRAAGLLGNATDVRNISAMRVVVIPSAVLHLAHSAAASVRKAACQRPF